MPNVIAGHLLASAEDRYAIAVARFNDLVTERLLDGAINSLERHGVAPSSIDVVRVAGSFELPVVAQKLARSVRYAAVIALGAVIQGETDHHDYINHAVAQGLMAAAQQSGIPILFGVLTCRTMEQALDRAGGKSGNKGAEAALAAIESVSVLKQLS